MGFFPRQMMQYRHMMQYLQVVSLSNSFITEEGTFSSEIESASLAYGLGMTQFS